MIEPGDFVIDEARADPKKGRVLYRDLGRPDAFFVRFTDGSTTSVGTTYLRKLEKKAAHEHDWQPTDNDLIDRCSICGEERA